MDSAKKPLGEIKSLFGGNPFATPVGQKIEQATDPSLPAENWGLNMEICDLINGSEEGAKDAVRAIRKRLNSGKNYAGVLYTLTVLETCVKNCGHSLHVLVCQKDFVQELVKLIGPKNDPPASVQEKVLGLVQSWADTFQAQPDLRGVVEVYNDLRSKGIEFPPTDLDSMAPILTPNRSVDSEPILHQVDLGERQVKVSRDQVEKIRRDLDMVQGNMSVFAEMLGEMKPGLESPADLELMHELYTTCKEMQRRIADLLSTVSSDELIAQMLHVNDELNNLFLRYGRYRKNVKKTEGGGDAKGHREVPEPSLIDFGDAAGEDASTEQVTSKLSGLGVRASKPAAVSPTSRKVDDADFDDFAASRTGSSKAASRTGGSTYADNSNVDQHSSLRAAAMNKDPTGEDLLRTHRQSDFDEMEAWLKANPGAAGGETSLSSSEFDKFLQERASAAGTQQRPAPSSAKKMDKEGTENKMFGL